MQQTNTKGIHDWVVKMIHWELCQRLKVDHADKWYLYKPEPVMENETYKILRNFEIQTDRLVQAKIIVLLLINKKKITYHLVDFVFSADHRMKVKESEKLDKYLNLRELIKLWSMWVMVILIIVEVLGTVPKYLENRLS